MAPAAVGAQVRVLVAAKGGAPAGDEDALAEEARQRLRYRYLPADAVTKALRVRYVWAMELLIRYLGNSLDEDELKAMDPASYGELVHELFLVVVGRTKSSQKYS